MTVFKSIAYFFCFGFFLSSCGAYRQNIMFKLSDKENLKLEIRQAEANYTIQKNDRLSLEVYANQGEKLVDPQDYPANSTGIPETEATPRTYLVDINGVIKLPRINELKLEGLTIRQAEEILQKEYEKFYPQAFVLLSYANKRVVVLGTSGGQVIPLSNENMRLTEILALSKSMTPEARANNIRVLRNNQVLLADLSTFSGYSENNILIQPNDVIYVEPVRRPVVEALRDYSPFISIISSLTAVVVVILSLNQ